MHRSTSIPIDCVTRHVILLAWSSLFTYVYHELVSWSERADADTHVHHDGSISIKHCTFPATVKRFVQASKSLLARRLCLSISPRWARVVLPDT